MLIVCGAAAGAFGAHALEGLIDARGLSSFETASRYAMVMGAALLGASATGERSGLAWVQGGTWLFSISIFMLVADRHLEGELGSFLGPVTPMGGAMMIAGWLIWLLRMGKNQSGTKGLK